jgi:hypothetical protein
MGPLTDFQIFSYAYAYAFDSFYMDIQTHAELMQKRFYRLLFICEKDFIACCAYAETISLLVEHIRKSFITF